MVPLSVTSDLDFKVIFFNIEYLTNDMRQSHSYYRMSIGSCMRSIAWRHYQWPRWTHNPVFKVTAFLKSNIFRDSFYRTLIGNHMQSIECYHFQWPWMTADLDFKSYFLKSNIERTVRLKDKVTIAQEETIPNIWNGTMFGDLEWPLNALCGFVSISCASGWS